MKRGGFTLIELAIVLVIIGLLVGGSFKILKVMRENSQIATSNQDTQAAVAAVIGNARLNNNTLPSNSFFQQNLSPLKNNQTTPLLYADDSALQNTNICNFKTTNLSIKTPTKTIANVAFAVVSAGPNNNMQTAVQTKGGQDYIQTYNYSTKIDNSPTPINIKENYDDVIQWVTLPQLQQTLQCSDNPFRIVNTSLPSTDVANAQNYAATIVVDGNYTAPSSSSCTFSPDDGFVYNPQTLKITNTGKNVTSGTVAVTCSVTVNGGTPNAQTAKKIFVITVNESSAASQTVPQTPATAPQTPASPPTPPANQQTNSSGNNGFSFGKWLKRFFF